MAGHKVSGREHLKTERDRLFHEHGSDEGVFLNEKEEVVEGSRTNIFVRLGDALWTPPLASGCLDGCLRQQLLETGAVQERSLTIRDLTGSEALFLGNSLRGLILAKLIGPAQN